jgi:hypothetical protein
VLLRELGHARFVDVADDDVGARFLEELGEAATDGADALDQDGGP